MSRNAIGRRARLSDMVASVITRQLISKSLVEEAIDRAYPTARAATPGLGVADWRRFAQGLIASEPSDGGVLTVENRLGTIQGLCSYRFEPALGEGLVCSADNLVALDLIDNAPVLAALLRVLADIARRRGATALRLDLPCGTEATRRLVARLGTAGHRIEAVRLVKRLHERL
jgi:hypothetical protein